MHTDTHIVISYTHFIFRCEVFKNEKKKTKEDKLYFIILYLYIPYDTICTGFRFITVLILTYYLQVQIH